MCKNLGYHLKEMSHTLFIVNSLKHTKIMWHFSVYIFFNFAQGTYIFILQSVVSVHLQSSPLCPAQSKRFRHGNVYLDQDTAETNGDDRRSVADIFNMQI